MIILSTPADLATELKRSRHANNQRLQDIAEAGGLHKSSLSQYENGLFTPQLDRVIRWAKACGYHVALVPAAEVGQQ